MCVQTGAPRRSVVVVEPDEGIRDSLKFLLEADDYAVWAFRDAESLLAAAERFGADAFILSDEMPGVSGSELLGRLRAAHAEGRVLFLAGRPSREMRRQASALDAAILQKPVLGDALRTALRDMLAPGRDPH